MFGPSRARVGQKKFEYESSNLLPVLVGAVKKGNGKDDNDDCGRHFIMIRISIAIQMIITVVERGPTLSLAFAFA